MSGAFGKFVGFEEKDKNMKLKLSHAIAFALAFVFCVPLFAARDQKRFEEALELFRHGMYARSMELFDAQNADPLSRDYALLCAIRLGESGIEGRISEMDSSYPRTMLYSQVHFEYALLLFDGQNYDAASAQFDMVSLSALSEAHKCEYWYKKGFSAYNVGDMKEARDCFMSAIAADSKYLNPSRFALGCVCYRENSFSEAISWFNLTRNDPRFAVMSEFYIVDCRFMLGDYAYVISEGEKIFDDLSMEGKRHISRLLAESYMVSGDARKAGEYLSQEDMSKADDNDWFHAGSIHYALGQYASAVKCFEAMSEKRDSLAQVAAYQCGFSYIKLKNKLKAMDCFQTAGELSFDANIQEDAFFNYAKLAFDLDGNYTPFSEYIARYSTSRKGDMIYGYVALSALRNSDWGMAIEAYDKMDELDDAQKLNYVKACYLRSRELIANGSWSEALRYLKASSAYFLPQNDALNQLCRFNLAETYYRVGDYDSARQVYTRLYNLSALDSRPEGRMIPYGIAYTYFQQKDWNSAAKWFDNCIKDADSLTLKDSYLRRADCDFARRDYKSSSRSYREYVSRYPSRTDIYPYYRLGLSYGLCGEKYRRVEALSMVRDAPAGSKWYNEALYELGRAYNDVGDSLLAIKTFALLRNSTADPVFKARARMGQGMVLRNSGRYGQALACYEDVVQEMKGTEFASVSLQSIQSIYTAMKHPEKYIEYIEANNLDTSIDATQRRNLYYNTAEQIFLAGNYDLALTSFNRFLSEYPSDSYTAMAYYYLGEAYKALGNKEKACDYFAKALDGQIDAACRENALLGYASLSFSLERYRDAFSAYLALTQTENLLSSKLDAWTGLMRSAYMDKNFESAGSAAKVVRANAGDDALKREASYVMAKSLLSSGQRDEAMKLFETLSDNPDSGEGAEARYIIIKSRFDAGDFAAVETLVYDFASAAPSQSYWLAKSFIVLGDSFAERGNIEQAVITWTSVRDGYTPSAEGDDILPTVTEKLNSL